MARASTESDIVTPHWSEIVSAKVISFIDLKMLSWAALRAAVDMEVSRSFS